MRILGNNTELVLQALNTLEIKLKLDLKNLKTLQIT